MIHIRFLKVYKYASNCEIQKAFHELSLQHHLDKNNNLKFIILLEQSFCGFDSFILPNQLILAYTKRSTLIP